MYESYNIYCGSSPEIHLNEIFEILKKEKISEDWFFIRYSDEAGFHFRLRIKKEKSSNIYNLLLGSGIINLIKISSYVRELERYGGSENMELIEVFFNKSSEFVRSFLIKHEVNYDNILLISAVTNYLLCENQFSPREHKILNDTAYKQWLKYNSIKSDININKLDALYKTAVLKIENSFFMKFLDLKEYILSNYDKYFDNLNLKNINKTKEISVFNSLNHMSNNRLGVKNYDEPYLSLLNNRILQYKMK